MDQVHHHIKIIESNNDDILKIMAGEHLLDLARLRELLENSDEINKE
jgi:hypothetical protein